jgi:hypothetical protein
MANDVLVFNRFRANSVAGRMLALLADGRPRTDKQIARSAKPRSVDNILAPGGWYVQLRAFGKKTRKFVLAKTDDGKIVMTVRRGVKVAA